MKKLTLLLTLLLFVPVIPAAQCDYYCADANIDGSINVGDAVYIMNYLYSGGPPPLDNDLECANWDNFLTLTVNDVWWILKWVFGQAWPPEECPPTGAPIAPVVDSSTTLYYTDWVSYGAGAGVIALTLQKELEWYVFGLSFPLRIRIDGEIPAIDSVVFADYLFVGYTVYEDSGEVAIGIVPLFSNDDWIAKQIAHIYVSTPAAPGIASVSMEWVSLTPVQAPTQDSSVIPMFLNYFDNGVEPLLEPHCCLVPGDANMDGSANIGDAIFIINCVFKDCLGHDCESQIDANCDGAWNLGDAVYIVNYVFRSGPPPCCF
jgi:hypothetical protein